LGFFFSPRLWGSFWSCQLALWFGEQLHVQRIKSNRRFRKHARLGLVGIVVIKSEITPLLKRRFKSSWPPSFAQFGLIFACNHIWRRRIDMS
jgi:hypothetical protein